MALHVAPDAAKATNQRWRFSNNALDFQRSLADETWNVALLQAYSCRTCLFRAVGLRQKELQVAYQMRDESLGAID